MNAKTQQDDWKNSKDEKYNPALREMIKLYLNSLSGKVGQREYTSDIGFCFTENQMQTFISTHSNIIYDEIPKMNCVKLEGDNDEYIYNPKSAKPVHIAAFIYSYARSHMYRSLLSKVDTKFFTDTDSCHLLEEDILKLEDEGPGFGKFHLGGEFGDYEKEIAFKVDRYYAVAPKCYAMFGGDKEKIKFKGINQKFDRIMDVINNGEEKKYRKENVKEFNKKTIIEKFNLHESLPLASSELLFQNLTSKKCVAILTSPLKRSTGIKSIASLHQTFIIKTIAAAGEVHN